MELAAQPPSGPLILPEDHTGPSLDQYVALGALQRRSIYGGTVDPVTIAERRRQNKAARKSRRLNRRTR
jgi:hypothetical protein